MLVVGESSLGPGSQLSGSVCPTLLSLLVLSHLLQASELFSPSNITVEELTSDTMRLSWDFNEAALPLLSDPGSVSAPSQTYFRIYYWRVNMSANPLMASTRDLNLTLTGLRPGAEYSIWLLGLHGNMTSDYVTLKQRTGRTYRCLLRLVIKLVA